jgi:hypothetical protein
MMERYKGFWKSGSALPGPPYTRYWESLGCVLKDGRIGTVTGAGRIQEPRHHVRSRRPGGLVRHGTHPHGRRPLLAAVVSGSKSAQMPSWFKRFLFLVIVGVAAWVEGYSLGPFGFGWVAVALVITVALAIGWMRTYWNG